MDLYPAIDIRGGRLVRLVEGDFDRETVYGEDPVAVAEGFARAGAAWIHVVDLDAARRGTPANRTVVGLIAAALRGSGTRIQTGGGVRSLADVEDLLGDGAGVDRVVIGTAAVETPDLVRQAAARWPGQVAVGLDHRDGEVRLRGWVDGGGRRLGELVPEAVAAGASAVIITDIARDGRQVGPDVDGLAAILAATGAPIIASGGVSGRGDIERLSAVRTPDGTRGLVGVIAGKAVYEGNLDVAATVKWLATSAHAR